MKISKEVIKSIKKAHDVREVIESCGLKLRKKGADYVGPCPFFTAASGVAPVETRPSRGLILKHLKNIVVRDVLPKSWWPFLHFFHLPGYKIVSIPFIMNVHSCPKQDLYRRVAEDAEGWLFYLAGRGRQIKRPLSCQNMQFSQTHCDEMQL